MSLGFKFYVKYLAILVPCLIIAIPMQIVYLFNKDKAIDMALKNKALNKLNNWLWR